MCEPGGYVSAQSLPRIMFNALALRPEGSGVQTYERELLQALVCVVRADLRAVVQADAAVELPPGVHPVVRPTSSGARRALAGLRSQGPCDVFHGLDVDLPARPRAPTVSTVHDLSVFDVPRSFPRRRVIGERILVASALKRADVVIAVSGFTAERVWKRFGRECVVIGESPPPDLCPPTDAEIDHARALYGLPRQFVLHVGNIEPRKNLDVLARACVAADVPLVLAGMRRGRTVPPATAVTIGYVPRHMLRGLYGAATMVAFCPLYEGFGLPAVEAMACGTPVVASRIPPLVESLSGAAEFVPPGDAGALAAAIGDLFADADRRHDLADRGKRRVASSSWEAVAEATAQVYRSLGANL